MHIDQKCSKDIYNVTKYFYYKQMLFFWTFLIHQRIPKKKFYGFHKNKKHNCFNFDDNKNHHVTL